MLSSIKQVTYSKIVMYACGAICTVNAVALLYIEAKCTLTSYDTLLQVEKV